MRLTKLIEADVLHQLEETDQPSTKLGRQRGDFRIGGVYGLHRPVHTLFYSVSAIAARQTFARGVRPRISVVSRTTLDKWLHRGAAIVTDALILETVLGSGGHKSRVVRCVVHAGPRQISLFRRTHAAAPQWHAPRLLMQIIWSLSKIESSFANLTNRFADA